MRMAAASPEGVSTASTRHLRRFAPRSGRVDGPGVSAITRGVDVASASAVGWSLTAIGSAPDSPTKKTTMTKLVAIARGTADTTPAQPAMACVSVTSR